MLFNLLLAILLSYVFYQHATVYMLKARIMDKVKEEKIGYVMFLLSGTFIGEFLGISLPYSYIPDSWGLQIVLGTFCSILIGESFYYYNKRLIRRIPSIQDRRNY